MIFAQVVNGVLGTRLGTLGFEPGATIPDPARPQVADRGTALRYGGQGRQTAAPADQLAAVF